MVLFLSDIISRVFADAITIEVITVRNAISDKKRWILIKCSLVAIIITACTYFNFNVILVINKPYKWKEMLDFATQSKLERVFAT